MFIINEKSKEVTELKGRLWINDIYYGKVLEEAQKAHNDIMSKQYYYGSSKSAKESADSKYDSIIKNCPKKYQIVMNETVLYEYEIEEERNLVFFEVVNAIKNDEKYVVIG